MLKKYQNRPLKIGSFSVASNVTGIGSKTRDTAVLLHKYGAYSFWDFAAVGSYVQIEMNLSDDDPDGHLAYKDAIFISPHKFIGGSGILVAKRHLFTNQEPAVPGEERFPMSMSQSIDTLMTPFIEKKEEAKKTELQLLTDLTDTHKLTTLPILPSAWSHGLDWNRNFTMGT